MKTSKTKKRFLLSLVAVIACVAMLIGTTFAWFTDSVSNTGNRIQAGTLDVDLLMYKKNTTSESYSYQSIAGGQGDIFKEADKAQNSNATLWEPGKTQVVFLAVKNEGNLALKYNIRISTSDVLKEDSTTEYYPSMVQNNFSALEYAVLDGVTKQSYDELAPQKWADITGATGVQKGDMTIGTITAAPNGSLKPVAEGEGGIDYFALAVHMKEEAGNDFQNAAVTIDVNVVATQETYEKDGFDSDQYDARAQFPVVGEAKVVPNKDTIIKGFDDNNNLAAKAKIPASAQEPGGVLENVNKIEMTVDETDKPTGISIQTNEKTLSYDVKFFSVAENGNKTQITDFGSTVVSVDLSAQLPDGADLLKVYHTHAGVSTEMTKITTSVADVTDGKFYFDTTTKMLTVGSKTFSPFTFVYKEKEYTARIEGKGGYDTLDEALAAAVNGDTVKLLKDVSYSNDIVINKNISLDLGGNTITSTATNTIVVDSNMNKFINGTIVTTGTYGIYVAKNSNASIQELNVDVANCVYPIYFSLQNIGSIAKISGGSYIGKASSQLNYGLYVTSKGTVTEISGGKFQGSGGAIYNNGTISKISGGIFGPKLLGKKSTLSNDLYNFGDESTYNVIFFKNRPTSITGGTWAHGLFVGSNKNTPMSPDNSYELVKGSLIEEISNVDFYVQFSGSAGGAITNMKDQYYWYNVVEQE